MPGSPGALEEEASEEGAFNEETGEINWDCPCLGGMAYGPCGEQFRVAFSCFVFSKEEPKGMDCIEHFKTMQNCFREHPDVYGSELTDDDDAPQQEFDGPQAPAPAEPVEPESQPQPAASVSQSIQSEEAPKSASQVPEESSTQDHKEHVKAVSMKVQEENPPISESDDLMPKVWHDSREANKSS